MADTSKAEDVVENVANGDAGEVKDPAVVTASGDGEVEKTEGKTEAKKSQEAVAESDKVKEQADEKDAAAEEHGDAEENGHDEENGTHSPDHKRKDTNDHYRDGNKRTRGGGRGRGGRGRGDRGRGRGGFDNPRNLKSTNIKRTFDDQPESNDPVEIRRQVEFYFSDSNLPIDGYLLGMTEGSKNVPVDLRTIHNFKRMRHFQPFSAVTDAVKESRVLDVEEKDNTAYVTRKVPLDTKFSLDTSDNKRLLTSDTMERSIYAKGFGEETKSTHLDIEDFFAPYGPINSIRLRRSEDGEFKGSVFVEFADVETQKHFLDLDPKPKWGEGGEGDDEGKELQILSKQIYVDRKHQDILDGTVRPRSPRRSSGYRGHSGNFKTGRGYGRGGGGDFKKRRFSDKRDRSRSPGQDDWKARRDRDQRSGNRGDRKRGGGRGRGRGGRGGGDNRTRRETPESEREDEQERSRSPHGDGQGDEMNENEAILTRAEAEAKKAKVNGTEDDEGGAGKTKKRAREDEDEGGVEGESEAKKVKETEVEA